jgi:hypothetical protein
VRFLNLFTSTPVRKSALAFIGIGLSLAACNTQPNPFASRSVGHTTRSVPYVTGTQGASTSSITAETTAPLPTHPCSYFSLIAAEKVARRVLNETIDRVEQPIGYSVCEYNGTRRNINIDISAIPAGSSSFSVTQILTTTFSGFPHSPAAVPGLGQQAYMDTDADPGNGYINSVYQFVQNGLIVETIAVVGSADAPGSEDSLRTAEFEMASLLSRGARTVIAMASIRRS